MHENPRGVESYSRLLLRDQLLGSDSETINFTLDDSGEWEKQKNYATVGSHVKANGEVLSPATFAEVTRRNTLTCLLELL